MLSVLSSCTRTIRFRPLRLRTLRFCAFPIYPRTVRSFRLPTMFRYPPLAGSTSYRVLALHPGTGQEEVRASLLQDEIYAQKHKYEAFSYFLGPLLFPRRIQIHGENLTITQTLYDALVSLRLPNKDRTIWADAICIDQESITERNHQVRLMSRIYTRCSRCIVHLGPEAGGSEILGEVFEDV